MRIHGRKRLEEIPNLHKTSCHSFNYEGQTVFCSLSHFVILAAEHDSDSEPARGMRLRMAFYVHFSKMRAHDARREAVEDVATGLRG